MRELLLSDLGPDYAQAQLNISKWLKGPSELATDIGSELDNHDQAAVTVRCVCPSTSTTRVLFSRLFQLDKYLREVPSITESPCICCLPKMMRLLQGGLVRCSSMPLVGIESALGNKVLR